LKLALLFLLKQSKIHNLESNKLNAFLAEWPGSNAKISPTRFGKEKKACLQPPGAIKNG